jgi:hypothetical protein
MTRPCPVVPTNTGPHFEQLGCDIDTVQESICRQFMSDSPCGSEVCDVIPFFWELAAPESCYSTFIRALIVKREVVQFLMGCEAYSVDSYDRHRSLTDVTVADSRSDFRAQSQSTGNTARFQKGHGETRYDEASRGDSDGLSTREQRGTEVGDGTSTYRDDGRGGGFNNSSSVSSIEALEQRQHLRTVQAASQETGSRRDCNYEFSTNNTAGVGAGGAIVFLGIGGGMAGTFTGSGSEWRKYTQTGASDEETSFRETHTGAIHEINDERKSSGVHDWDSHFLADIEWNERDYEVRRNRDRNDARRHAEAHSHGDGDGLAEDKTEGRMASQGTSKVESRSDTTRTRSKTDVMTTIQLANSQRFRNLNMLYNQLTQQILHARARLRAQISPQIGYLGCNCSGCCTCGGSLRYAQVGLTDHQCNLMGLGRMYGSACSV